MPTIEEEHATILKENYGEDFFTFYLTIKGAPTTISNNSQLSGLIRELKTFLQGDDDITEVIENINEFIRLDDEQKKERAINLLTNLGITYNSEQLLPSLYRTTAIRPTRRRTPSQDNDQKEKIGIQHGIPEGKECPICSETIGNKGYYAEKCRNFFCEDCINQWCERKNECPCPMCRRKFKFINKNTRGGKNKSKKYKNKSRRNKRKTRKSR